MAIKFDHQKTKHQLFHLSISLATILVCMMYVQYNRNWQLLGSFWRSLIVPIVFIGEVSKVILCRYYSRSDDCNSLRGPRSTKKSSATSVSTLREFFSGILVQCLCTLLYAFICIILGAPVLRSYEQTFVLAVLLTMTTVSPTVLLLGGSGALQACFCEQPELCKSEQTALSLFKCHAIGGALGAWAGSVVTPLDWDRDWQIYPIPNIVGTLMGSALGNIYTCSRILYSTAIVYMNKKRL